MRHATNDMTEIMGIGNYVGEIRQGPDSQLYEWVEGVDGLGNPVGFWKKIKKVVSKVASAIPGVSHIRGMVKGFCSALPKIQPIASVHPAIGPFAQIGTKVCQALSKVGLAGVEGEIMQAPDGQHYEVVQGIGEFGERKTFLRPVRLIIPAHIRTGRYMRPRVTPMMPGAQAMPMMPGAQATPMMPGAQAVRTTPQAVPMQRVRPVRRYR